MPCKLGVAIAESLLEMGDRDEGLEYVVRQLVGKLVRDREQRPRDAGPLEGPFKDRGRAATAGADFWVDTEVAQPVRIDRAAVVGVVHEAVDTARVIESG